MVLRLVRQRDGSWESPSSQVFYRLRRKLMEVGMPRRLIRPETRVLEILEELGEERWPAVRSALEMPRVFRKPGWTEVAGLVGGVLVALAAKSMGGELWVGIMAGIVAGYLMHLVLLPLRAELRSNQSLRDITYILVGQERRKRKASGNVSDAEVWQVLRGILALTLAVPMERIERHSRLVQDLGAS